MNQSNDINAQIQSSVESVSNFENLIKTAANNDPFWETILKRFFNSLSDKSESDKVTFLNTLVKKGELFNEFLKEANNCSDVNALFSKYNGITNEGTLRKYKIDEDGKMYEEETKINFPDPMKYAKINMGISKLLDIEISDLNTSSKRIEESNATYYYNPIRGGKSVIVADDGTYLATGSAMNFEELLKEFNNGRRNGNFIEDNSDKP